MFSISYKIGWHIDVWENLCRLRSILRSSVFRLTMKRSFSGPSPWTESITTLPWISMLQQKGEKQPTWELSKHIKYYLISSVCKECAGYLRFTRGSKIQIHRLGLPSFSTPACLRYPGRVNKSKRHYSSCKMSLLYVRPLKIMQHQVGKK